MNWLWNVVWGLMPLWAWLILGVVAAVITYRAVGWQGVVGVIATTIGVVAYSRGAKRGVEVEQAKQAQADTKARETISQNRAENLARSDAELDREIERFTRP